MILLDTCVLYHWSAGTIPDVAMSAIERAEIRFLHAISAWEMACKHRDGKYPMSPDPETWMRTAIESLHLTVLVGDLSDGINAALLPLHHRDPADRLMIALAKRHNWPAVTSDAVWQQYGVQTVWDRPLAARNPRRRPGRSAP